jgi:hypothetical protein
MFRWIVSLVVFAFCFVMFLITQNASWLADE